MKRIEFNKTTKDIIARRAGYKCSFPGCNKTLVGPGLNSNEWITIGEYSHIFSAKKKGPRTSGNLSPQELKSPQNGIFLCRNHHKIIDTKSQDKKYTSDLLTRFKNRHEFRISAEIGEYVYPLNWINKIGFKGGKFKNEISFNLGKVTFITGNNETGKSTIGEILYSVFSQKIYTRWDKENSDFEIKIQMDNPVLSKFEAIIKSGTLKYKIDESEQPFVPYNFLVLGLFKDIREEKDDLKSIADCLNLDREFVRTMILTTSLKHGLFSNNITVDLIRENPYKVSQIKVEMAGFLRDFKSLSTTEKSRTVLDLVISYAAEISKYKSILLIMDWPETYNYQDETISPYINFLQSSKAHFQTLFISHRERPDLDWTGWMIAKFISNENGIQIIQNQK